MSNVFHITGDVITQFKDVAEKDIECYAREADLNVSEFPKLAEYIKKTTGFCRGTLIIEDDYITLTSIKNIQKKFSRDFKLFKIQNKLLQLLLIIIEKRTGIKSYEVPDFVAIKQEQPIITPDVFLNSTLHRDMYELLENENILLKYIMAPQRHVGVLALWLMLKEGIDKISIIKKILQNNCKLYRITEDWFIEDNERRYWLSPCGELLLTAYLKASHRVKNKQPMLLINRLLHDCRVLPPLVDVRFKDIRDALKIEYALKFGPVEWGLSSYLNRCTHLRQDSLYRLLTGCKLLMDLQSTSNETTLKSTTRQWNTWNGRSTRNGNKHYPTEATVGEQISLINGFIIQLEKLPRKKTLFRTKLIRDSLREWLHNKDHSRSYPWCWLVLAWMYQLLDKGGKNKSQLKLSTISSYVKYVAKGFIAEFSGTDPSLLKGIDWAEKLNAAAERIQTPSKKGYLIYFAEFLIDSNVCADLCISDLDITSYKSAVDANLITINEGKVILSEFDKLPEHKSIIAKLIFCLGLYCGLRRGEVQGLQYKDFQYNENLTYFNLHIRPNKYRDLKTTSSSRNIPLDVLLDHQHKKLLLSYLKVSKTKFLKETSLIFPDESLLNDVFNMVTKTMQGVTGEDKIRYHHCRHSFTNWTWIRINIDSLKTEPYPFLLDEYFSSANCERLSKRLELTSYTRKKMWVLSELLGHSSPDTTITSYLHLVEFIRRSRFASHHPAKKLLRAFWGDRIVIDQWSRVYLNKAQLVLKKETFPKQIAFAIADEAFDIESIIRTDKIIKSANIELSLIWRIIRRAAEGHSEISISDGLSTDLNIVKAVLEEDQKLSIKSAAKSHRKIANFANYEKLNQTEIKHLQYLINSFQAKLDVINQSNLNLGRLEKLVASLVPSQDYLIRSADYISVLTLLRLLQLMGIPAERIKLKWYLPNLNMYSNNLGQNIKRSFSFWKDDVLANKYNYKLDINVIVPKDVRDVRSDLFDGQINVTRSDEAKYLPFKSRGFIGVYYLGEMGKRTKAFISFIKLLAIFSIFNR